jgi:hypothetical protein
MPQISSAKQGAFLAWLKGAGVAVGMALVAPSALAATQAEICPEKVARMASAPASVKAKPVIVSVEGWILDGHHHVAHAAATGAMVPVAVVGLEIEKLLEVAKTWTEAA